jgi:hypothetical protein
MGSPSARKSEVSKVTAYIQNQERQHAENNLKPEFEQVVEEV